MINWKKISDSISDATQSDFSIIDTAAVAGGDSNQAWQISGSFKNGDKESTTRYFVKTNSADQAAMFAAEIAGLAAIADTHTVKVPCSITLGVSGQHNFLVLEYLDLAAQGNNTLLGNQLAAMHHMHAKQFGWLQDNTIGVTIQHNNWCADWVSFWREQRLGFQLELASHNGYRGKLQELGKNVQAALPDLFAGYTPQPSLLHGDLWGGNHAFLPDGTPVIFDPATYYGDREADIAMTELFGGFAPEFYAAYRKAYPLDAGYAKRKTLYNLYHILNHCNMVSSGYVLQAERMMQSLLAKK
jgi:fructosamine-3-kinase